MGRKIDRPLGPPAPELDRAKRASKRSAPARIEANGRAEPTDRLETKADLGAVGRPSAASRPDRRPPRLISSPLHWLGRVLPKAVAGAALGALLLGGCAATKTQLGHAGPPAPDPAASYRVETTILGEGASLTELRFDEARELETARRASAIDPAGVLSAVESGRAVVRVPFEPGVRTVQGKRFVVRPGTELEVAVEVRDGRVVPTAEGRTSVRITPPIEGPLWTSARGVHLERSGEGRGRLLVDVGGWWNSPLGGERGLDLASFVESMRGSGPSGSNSLLDFSQASFRVDGARFAEGPLEVGELALELDSGNRIDVQGNLQSMSLEGRVRVKGGSVDGDALSLELGATELDLDVATQRLGSGDVEVTARASELDVRAPRLSARGANGDTLELRDARALGTLEAIARFSPELRPEAARVAFSGRIDAAVPEARFTLQDDEGDATARLSADRIRGQLTAGGDRLELDARLRGARIEIADLDRAGRSRVDHARFEGDAQVRVDGAGALSAAIDARALDVQIADYRSEDGRVDLGATRVRGAGVASVDPSGIRIEGDIEVEGTIDDLRVAVGDSSRFDLAAGSTLSGRLRRLEVPVSGPPRLEGRAELDFRLEDLALSLPGTWLEGQGRLSGPAGVRLGAEGLELRDADARLELTARDGRLAALERLELDMASGSRAILHVRSASFGGDLPGIEVGPGSELELRLDGGRLRTAGRDIRFDPGSYARFEIESLEVGPEGLPELVGALEIDAPLDLGTSPEAFRVPGRPDVRGPSAAGVRVEQVRLRSDGSFDLDGLDLHLDTRTGDVTGVRPSDRRRLAPLLAARPGLATHQDLVNHFYEVGGGEWAGAARAAQAYGLDLSKLVEDRAGASAALLPADRLDAAYARSELDMPSLAEVRASSAEDLAGIALERGELDPWALGREVIDGELHFEVPLEGTIGRWPESVSFEPGTTLTLVAEVEEGELVDVTARLSASGDAFLWTTLDGAYLDDERSLRLDISGWPDGTIGGLERLPRDVSSLVERLERLAEGGGSDGASTPIDFSQAKLRIADARLAPGTELALPFGRFTLGEGAVLDARGGFEGLDIAGRLALDDWAMSAGNLAVDAHRTTAEARVRVVPREDGGFDARLVFEALEGSIRGLAFKYGDTHIALGAGEVGGRLEIDVRGDAEGRIAVRGDVDLRRFEGEVRSARFVHQNPGDPGPPGRFELAGAQLDGRLRVRPTGAVEVSGRAEGLDGAIRDLTLTTVDGPLRVEDARFAASAHVDYRPGQLIALDGALRGSAVVASDPEDLELGAGLLRDVRVEGGRAVVTLDLEHFDELSHGPDRPLVLENLEGHLGGSGHADRVEGTIDPRPRPGPDG